MADLALEAFLPYRLNRIAAAVSQDFRSVYGPFSVSVSLMMWAFVSRLLMLAGAHYSASRHALRLASEVSARHLSDPESDI